MKLEKLFAVSIVAALAAAAAGCRYNKAGADGADGANGSGAEAVDVAGGHDEEANVDTMVGLNATDDGTLASALASGSDVPFDQNPNFKPVDGADFAPVYFGFDSTVVPQGEVGKIDAVIQHLSSKPERVVVIEGNCDERGSNEYNMALGENRSVIIRNYLVQGGIDASRIQTRSFGEEKPAVDGHDESAWARNRRGEFAIYQK